MSSTSHWLHWSPIAGLYVRQRALDWLITIIALVLGAPWIIPIGGADMPVDLDAEFLFHRPPSASASRWAIRR
jgi:hypothetical protein